VGVAVGSGVCVGVPGGSVVGIGAAVGVSPIGVIDGALDQLQPANPAAVVTAIAPRKRRRDSPSSTTGVASLIVLRLDDGQ